MSKAERVQTIRQEQRAYYENKGEEVYEVSVVEKLGGRDKDGFREYVVVVAFDIRRLYAFSIHKKFAA